MTTTTQIELTNGLDTAAQQQIIGALTNNAQLAQVTFHAQNNWMGSTTTRSTISRFSIGGQDCTHDQELKVDTDLPGPFLGSDQAPAPAEHALQALAACMNTTMVYNCAAQGIEVRSSTAFIEGELDSRGFLRIDGSPRAGYRSIRVRFEVDSDASPELIEALVRQSPMFDVFANPVPIDVAIEPAGN
jgi:uncharacterized OsmC-like protein